MKEWQKGLICFGIAVVFCLGIFFSDAVLNIAGDASEWYARSLGWLGPEYPPYVP